MANKLDSVQNNFKTATCILLLEWPFKMNLRKYGFEARSLQQGALGVTGARGVAFRLFCLLRWDFG